MKRKVRKMNDEYISRKKAIETIQYRVCQGYGNIEHICQRGSCAYCGIMEVMSDISSIEAADVQPVISGDNCIVCGHDVRKDNVYYDVNGGTICESCMNTKCKCKNGR